MSKTVGRHLILKTNKCGIRRDGGMRPTIVPFGHRLWEKEADLEVCVLKQYMYGTVKMHSEERGAFTSRKMVCDI